MPLDWTGVALTPVLAANQLLVEVDVVDGRPDNILISFGQASPPPIVGTPQEQADRLSNLGSVPVTPVARLSVTKGRLEEWVGILSGTLEQIKAASPESS